MSKRVLSMAAALYGAHYDVPFGAAKKTLDCAPQTLSYFSKLAAMAIDHIPYLPPEEPEPCHVCGQEMPKPKRSNDFQAGYEHAKHDVDEFIDGLIEQTADPKNKGLIRIFASAIRSPATRPGWDAEYVEIAKAAEKSGFEQAREQAARIALNNPFSQTTAYEAIRSLTPDTERG